MPCQVRLSLTSPPTTFSFTPKTQPTKTLLHSQIQAYLFTLHPLCPTTSTEPPPHPTRGGHKKTSEHDDEVLGLGSFILFYFIFFTRFLFFAWDWSPSPMASRSGERIISVTSEESYGNGDGWLDSATGFEWDFWRRRYDCEFPGANFIKLRTITPCATLGFLSKKIKKDINLTIYSHGSLLGLCFDYNSIWEL